MRLVLATALALILAAAPAVKGAIAEDAASQCMPMTSITSLSFEPGMTLTRRRTANVPTLNCVGNCPSNAFLSGAQCRQTGVSDNGLPSWKCDGVFPGASAREQYRLGSVRVQCEGCTKAGDPNVVRGSCALTYSVQSRGPQRRWGHNGYRHGHGEPSLWGDFILMTLLFTAIIGCCYCVLKRRNHGTYYDDGYTTTTYQGVPLGPDGKPIPGAMHAVHHHHHGGGYGYGGGSGFGTGMFTGFLMGDMMARASHHGGGYYGGDDGYGGDYGGSYGGGDSWGGGGGFGGSDSV